MKKWKIIRTITIAILIIFIIIILWNLISTYTAKVTYPYPALGIDVNNWFDRFCINIGIIYFIYFWHSYGGRYCINNCIIYKTKKK